MDIKNQVVIKQLIKSLTLIKKKPLKLAYPVLTDMAFLFIYGFFSFIITNKITYYLSSVYELTLESTETFTSSFVTKGIFSAIMQTPGADVLLKKALLWIIVLIVLIYTLYSFFQALSWRLSLNIVKHKKIKPYMKKFFLINLFWLLFFIVYNIISLLMGFRKQIASRYIEVSDFSISLIIFAALWFYFMFISYSLIEQYKVKESIKKTFIIGIKKIKNIFPMYLIIFIGFYIVNYTMTYFGKINQKIMLFIGIFIFLPLLVLARLYIHLVVAGLDGKKN